MFRRDFRKPLSQPSCLLKEVDVLIAGFTVHHQVEQFEKTGTQSSQKESKQGVTHLGPNELFRKHQIYKRL